MDDDVTRALAAIRQDLATLKSALGIHSAAEAEAVIQRLVNAVENQGDNQQQDDADLVAIHAALVTMQTTLVSLIQWAKTMGYTP